MKKQLSEIDPMYNRVISVLSKKSRLKYCEMIVDKIVTEIIQNKSLFENQLTEQWIETLGAARREIKKINEEN